jgi:hypothetical protein
VEIIVSPFQGFTDDPTQIPMALPWAIMFGPFGATDDETMHLYFA